MKAKFVTPALWLITGLLCSSGGIHFATYAGQGLQASAYNDIPRTRVYDVLPVAQRGSSEISLNGEWELAEAARPFTSEWVSAPGVTPREYSLDVEGLEWKHVQMPATIQYALFKAGAIPNPWYGNNWKKLQWIQDRDWYLRRRFQFPADWRSRRIRLRFDGMDYTGAVWLDGKFLGIHEGMFGGPTFDVTQAVTTQQDHELLVRLIHETEQTKVMKAWAIDGRGYDWGNWFRSIGLWRSIRLVSTGEAYMEAPWVRTDHADKDQATLWAQSIIINVEAPFQGTILAKIVEIATGKIVWREDSVQLVPTGTSYWERVVDIPNPNLWWPNGFGGQPLYRLELSLLEGTNKQDSITSRFGIRTIELRRNPYLPNKPRANAGLPEWMVNRPNLTEKQRLTSWGPQDLGLGDDSVQDDAIRNADENARFLFVVNGRPLYAKGVSWVTSDDLLTLTPEREGWLVNAARLARVNMFRLNGGTSGFETEQFYNLCDEAGIMVWQELPVNWDRTLSIPLATWREQLKQTVLRLRQHPSLALYVGGNETIPYVEGLTPYMGIGREVIAGYDNRPFHMAAGGGTDYHAYYYWSHATTENLFEDIWVGDPNWYLRLFGEDANFISEWSFSAYSNISTFERIVPASELDHVPVGYDTDKFLKAHPLIHDRLYDPFSVPFIHRKASSYGDLSKADFAQLIEYSQMAHADIYEYVFENWRGEFPYKGGEAVWTYNPTSPSSTGWHLIDWFGQPQIAYYASKRAQEPVHVMANTNYFSWAPGETFHASVFAVNDGDQSLRNAQIAARFLNAAMKPVRNDNWVITIPANGAKSESHEVGWLIPVDTVESYFFLEVTMTAADGRRLSQRAYCLRVLNSLSDLAVRRKWEAGPVGEPLTKTGPWLKPQIQGVPTVVSARVVDSRVADHELWLTVDVRNTGPNPAYPVHLAIGPDTYSVIWSDNYFWLAPGDSASIKGIVRLDMTGLDPITNPRVVTPSELTLFISAWNATVSKRQLQGP
jgi:beta-mannosidase